MPTLERPGIISESTRSLRAWLSRKVKMNKVARRMIVCTESKNACEK